MPGSRYLLLMRIFLSAALVFLLGPPGASGLHPWAVGIVPPGQLLNAAPEAVDDVFTMNEDGGLSDNVAGNDTDADDVPADLLWTLSNGGTAVLHGQLFFNPNGSFTYVPDADYNGTVAFEYRLCDDEAACDLAIVTITVGAVNDAPDAADDVATTSEEEPVQIAVTANDVDGDGNIASGSETIVFQPNFGTVSIGLGGIITYTPNVNYSGPDQFTYQICDDGTPLPAVCDIAVVNITVVPVNDGPQATGEAYFTTEGGADVNGDVSLNEFDLDDPLNALAWTVIDSGSAGQNGTLTFNSDGTFTYEPNANANGIVSFRYEVCDPGGLCADNVVLIFMTAVNDAPVATDDNESTLPDAILVANVIANDNDANDAAGGLDPGSLTVLTAAQNGTAVANANGTITYTPDNGFVGSDTVEYVICDLGDAPPSLCDTALLIINVNTDQPVAVDDFFSIDEDVISALDILDNDSTVNGALDPLTVTLLSPAALGIVVVNGDGSLTYTPNANVSGVDDFNYQVCNTGGFCATGTVTVTIQPVNDVPVAVGDEATTQEDADVTVTVLNNDSEPFDQLGDIDATSVTITTGPSNGGAVVNGDGSITYTPNTDFNGSDTLIYSVCDNGFPLPAACDTALLVITVQPVNDPPVINGDTLFFSAVEDFAVELCVIAADVDGDNIDIVNVPSGPLNGTATGLADGDTCFFYTPDPDFNGTDTVVVNVCDGNGACDQALAIITVAAVNDAPVVLDGLGLPTNSVNITTDEETPITACFDVLDVDGDAAQVSDFVNGPLNGFVNGFADGDTCFTYTPNVDYNGSDAVDIIVCDSNGACDTVTVNIQVLPVNDPPIIDDGNGNDMDTLAVTTPEDTPITLCIPATDADGDPLDITSYVNGPANGGVFNILDGNTCFTYAPNTDHSGQDTVSIVVDDSNGGTDTLVVIVTVGPVNDPPIITDEFFTPIDTLAVTTDEEVAVTVCLIAIDVDGDTVQVASVLNGPFNGAISGLADGDTCFTYTPGFNWNGTDSVDVLVCDDNGGCDTLAVTIIVLPVNDPPIITDGGPPADTILVNIQPDTPTEICLEAIDFDGDSLDVVSVINGPDSGAVNGVLDGDTCFTYTPNNGFVGSDTLTAVVGDGNGGSDTVVVVIGVFPNEPPVAAPDTLYVTVAEDGSVEPCPQATDADGDPLQVTGVVDLPAWGSASGFNDGDTCFFYFPTPDYNGGDTLSVLVCDPLNACDTVVVIIDVTPVNDVPIIVDGGGAAVDTLLVSTNEDEPLTLCLDAIDLDGDTLDVVSAVNGPTNGTITGLSDGDTCFTYVPAANYNGSDAVDIVLCDGNGGCDTVTVIIGVAPVNDAPVIVQDTLNVTTVQDQLLIICLDATDVEGDTLDAVTVINGPNSGQVTGVLDGDTCFTYTPNTGFVGGDTLTAVVCDDQGACDTVVVVIDVTEIFPNQPPVAVDDVAATTQGGQVIIDVLDNDSDPDGDPISIVVAVAGSGTVTDNGDGTVTYVPNSGFCGTDTITYTITDGFGGVDVGIVVVDVACPNQPPIAVDDSASTTVDTPVVIDVLDNDSDPDGDPIAVINGSAGNGGFVINGDGTITYIPDSGFCGTDTLVYTIADGNGGTDEAIVLVDVPCPNQPPDANDDYVVIDGDLAVIYVIGNDSDPDGDPIVVTSASALHGSVSINSDGTISYSPNAGFCGWDTIAYTICDPQPLCDEAIVVIEVLCQDNSLVVPQGFSPNGDNIGDRWVIQNLDLYPEASVIIFNRWGNEVFKADPYLNDWNGVSNHALTIGDVLPSGTYFYLLDLGAEGEPVRSGYIYLNK